jgi:hypothetical protein
MLFRQEVLQIIITLLDQIIQIKIIIHQEIITIHQEIIIIILIIAIQHQDPIRLLLILHQGLIAEVVEDQAEVEAEDQAVAVVEDVNY